MSQKCFLMVIFFCDLHQVYALETEALLKLHRHQEAYTAYAKGPNFAIESCINFFGLAVSAYLLMIRALVYMVSGRLEGRNLYNLSLDAYRSGITFLCKFYMKHVLKIFAI